MAKLVAWVGLSLFVGGVIIGALGGVMGGDWFTQGSRLSMGVCAVGIALFATVLFVKPPARAAIKPSLAQIEAAARAFDKLGRAYGWWPESTPAYDELDPIGKDELQSIVEGMLVAAAGATPLRE